MAKLNGYNPIAPQSQKHTLLQRNNIFLLYELLHERKIVQLKGPPGSGKTTFLDQLEKHIRQVEPDAVVVNVKKWETPVKKRGVFQRGTAEKTVGDSLCQ
ncbi:hypothetical protein VKT23_010601 [Stygiomarasmius scandens]|uniref:KAP NTPase domain-containing protein n=1 Tax=Marasmiellus scandens TaxID=2682957 RepID=A0ABR1JD96_9AGAR